jgi:hypothetical protein
LRVRVEPPALEKKNGKNETKIVIFSHFKSFFILKTFQNLISVKKTFFKLIPPRCVVMPMMLGSIRMPSSAGTANGATILSMMTLSIVAESPHSALQLG